MPPPVTVDAFLAALEHPLKPEIERVRRAILACTPGVSEHVKWNAPSFLHDGDDRVTLHLSRGRLLVVLHRGAKPKAKGFAFEDPTGLAEFRGPDRGVVELTDAQAVRAHLDALADLARRWMLAVQTEASAAAPAKAKRPARAPKAK